jgi:peptide subunit release factor RF-3
MSLEHTEWQDRKVNLIDVPGDPAFQGELRCAARVVEGALVTVSAVMGVETIGRMKGLSPRATPHRDGKVTYPPLYDLPLTHRR